ncbi:histidine ammonia-lyase [Arachidicoccus sp.]|uniref:histidine ammonia-lyase n=1 Tax=Arachidicoccus sp. TaxID=1872624 RepID=UPI003D19527B
MKESFKYGIDHLSVDKTIALANGRLGGIICEQAIQKIRRSSAFVDEIVEAKSVVYGINTGFGPLCDTLISAEQTTHLQHNLLKSHSVGVGNLIAPRLSKIMLILKLHALCQGYSGIRIATAERILWMIENDVIPCVPEQGSVGASGDLAPLAHLFLPLIGFGEVFQKEKVIEASAALEQLGLMPLQLGPKEGLALINGTQFIAAHAVNALERMHNALDAADIIGALSLEGLMGSSKPFDRRLHEIRPFLGNQLVAKRLSVLLANSEIHNAHIDCNRVQDPYSLRCMPQVHGASRTAWMHLQELTEIEINSVTDNPIILGSFDTISGGNFHGEPIAIPLDYATVAASELGSISERRCYLIIEGRYGLPKLLIENAGLNSGFMIPQYTAAALASENKSLCFPASADSIPTSLGQEDHVSMGSISGRKLNQVIGNVENILAIELLYAAQAVDFRRPLKSSPVLEAVHALVRSKVAFAKEDSIFSKDIQALQKIIVEGLLVKCANDFLVKNNIVMDN